MAALPLPIRPDVALAPLELEHAPKMFEWMCDPAVRENIGLRSDPSLERTAAWIENALRDDSIRAIAVLLAGRHVGNVVLDRIDRYLSTARFSIYIGEPSARGGGVGTSATYCAAEVGFRELGLYKIWLTVHCRNRAAIQAYKKVGFVQEGVLRGEFLLDGERLDALYMGLLKDDFEQLPVAGLKGAT